MNYSVIRFLIAILLPCLMLIALIACSVSSDIVEFTIPAMQVCATKVVDGNTGTDKNAACALITEKLTAYNISVSNLPLIIMYEQPMNPAHATYTIGYAIPQTLTYRLAADMITKIPAQAVIGVHYNGPPIGITHAHKKVIAYSKQCTDSTAFNIIEILYPSKRDKVITADIGSIHYK